MSMCRTEQNKCGKCPVLILNIMRIFAVVVVAIIGIILLVRSTLASAHKMNPTSIYMKIMMNALGG